MIATFRELNEIHAETPDIVEDMVPCREKP